MNVEKSGFQGQCVTTWGRPSEGSTYTGPSQALKTVTSCRCGKTHTHPDFPSIRALKQDGWVMYGREHFCSLACAVQFRPQDVREFQAYLATCMVKTQAKITSIVEAFK